MQQESVQEGEILLVEREQLEPLWFSETLGRVSPKCSAGEEGVAQEKRGSHVGSFLQER